MCYFDVKKSIFFRETGISQKFKGRRDSNTHYEIHNGLGTSYYDLNEAEFSWAVFEILLKTFPLL